MKVKAPFLFGFTNYYGPIELGWRMCDFTVWAFRYPISRFDRTHRNYEDTGGYEITDSGTSQASDFAAKEPQPWRVNRGDWKELKP